MDYEKMLEACNKAYESRRKLLKKKSGNDYELRIEKNGLLKKISVYRTNTNPEEVTYMNLGKDHSSDYSSTVNDLLRCIDNYMEEEFGTKMSTEEFTLEEILAKEKEVFESAKEIAMKQLGYIDLPGEYKLDLRLFWTEDYDVKHFKNSKGRH